MNYVPVCQMKTINFVGFSKVVVSRPRIEQGRRSFKHVHRATIVWNSLPVDTIKQLENYIIRNIRKEPLI